MRRWCCQGRRFISSPTARFLTALKNGAAFTPTWTVARVRRPVGAGRPALVDRATADQAADPPPAAQHRSAVPAGGDRPGRLKPNERRGARGSWRGLHGCRRPVIASKTSKSLPLRGWPNTQHWGRIAGAKATSSRRNQAVRLVRREVTGCIGSDALLEAADGCVGQWPEDAVYRPFVIVQAIQRLLNLPAISCRHLGFRPQHASWLWGCGCRGRRFG